ncbi:MAG: hypothetical protein WC308_04055 [archaeon]|jgi:hypothetical protein
MDKTITYAVIAAVFLQIILLIAVPSEALGEMKTVLMALPIITILLVIIFAALLGGKKKRVSVKAGKSEKSVSRGRNSENNSEEKDAGKGGKEKKKGFFSKFFSGSNGGGIQKLETEKKTVLEELKQTENQFLKHRIDQDTFDSLSNEKNTRLVKLEAEIDSKKNSELNGEELKKLEQISAKKRRVLEELLKQRQKKVVELKIAEKAYLKRRISEASFKKMSSEIKSELISVNSKISLVQTEEEVGKIKENLKAGLQEIDSQKKISKGRKIEELEDDVFEQIEQNAPKRK